ncbi:MAG: class I mannose-6-phosphate isomerase [Actinobacteria bacterium]|nr:class I mannose-6-phosphate isomerase [Actinomycetota bacterium]
MNSSHSAPSRRPLVLPPNQLHRFYLGGPAIAELRGIPSEDPQAPEDWVGSATAEWGSSTAGLARFEDGTILRDAMANDPEDFFGPEHADRFGGDPGVLVKILDAGQRLPVHFHPDVPFARRHLGLNHGKTEAWVIVTTSTPDAAVWVGWQDDIDPATAATWVETQSTDVMLDALHRFPVEPGDTLFLPGGMPHAIGEGILLVELQEPTDLSILMEWEGFDIDGAADGHLGLGFDLALQALDRAGWDRAQLADETVAPPEPVVDRPGAWRLFPKAADGFFRAERIRPAPETAIPAEFSILVVIAGEGRLTTASGGSLGVTRGATVLVPFAAGEAELSGTLDVLRCMSPVP